MPSSDPAPFLAEAAAPRTPPLRATPVASATATAVWVIMATPRATASPRAGSAATAATCSCQRSR
ncbi:hypothetical protein [Paramagnetospirillum marisnigri]|uniref:hypothetical protein n=1 Tax=Paramagnetospirillum marisnigri TaxID=1285242 RepID=UPI0012E8A97D|nr:hypothetical protein [Paramagnetospirillum marisnigri]